MSDTFRNPKDILEEMLLGQGGVLAKRGQEQLDLERKLAAIRAQSHALTWTGTTEELTETITRWYESGWLTAESLQDALQKASIHFAKPDGTPAIKPASTGVAQDNAAIFSPSPTYQNLTFRDKEYDLTGHKYAADIVRVLHQSSAKGIPGLTIAQIRKEAKLPHNGTMYDWFRATGLWKTLVVKSRDLYRLDI
jgi:hypothetical protein